MIDINFIKEYPEKFSKLMQQRNANISIENILKLDKNKKLKISELQKLQTERNSTSKLIGVYKKRHRESQNDLYCFDRGLFYFFKSFFLRCTFYFFSNNSNANL